MKLFNNNAKMKSVCYLKECDNFNEDYDCILHYTKVQNDALQRIILHYNAMKSKMEEVMNENVKYEEEAKKRCKKQFDSIYDIINKNRNGSVSSPETCINALSPAKKNNKSATDSDQQQSVKNVSGKENSPAKKSKSKSSRSFKNARLSIDPKPTKEKRSKQMKLPFFTTSSAKKRKQQEIDDDMTYCEELEKGLSSKANTSKNHDQSRNSSEVFNFESLENLRKHKIADEKEVTPKKLIIKESTPQRYFDIEIKKECDKVKSSKKHPHPPLSPELFLSDLSSSNSVVYVEPSEKEIISIPDKTYDPLQDIMRQIDKKIKESKHKKLFQDSISLDLKPVVNKPVEQREIYEGECMDCQAFYDDIVEKKSVTDANNEINNCPIKCDGWRERHKKKKESRNNGRVVIKCNSKFARRRKVEVNETAPSIWDLNIEPRRGKPLFSKNNENYETPDL